MTTVTDLTRLIVSDVDKLITYAQMPDTTDQIEMAGEIVTSIAIFYRSRGQYALAMQYLRTIYAYHRDFENLAARLDMEAVLGIEKARVLIYIGDTLWLQGKLQEAKESFQQAKRELDIVPEQLEKKLLNVEVSRKGWKTESHFMEVYASKEGVGKETV